MHRDASHPLPSVTCQHGGMIDAELEELKALFGVQTDIELAASLGIERSTIAQWRRRGRLPPRYKIIAGAERRLTRTKAQSEEALRRAIRGLVYRDPLYHLWLAACLSALPAGDFAVREGEDAPARGRRLERRIAELFDNCLNFSQAELGKVRPDGEADYLELVAALSACPPERA